MRRAEITNTPRPDDAQYCANWLTILKGDQKAIFTAAALATRTVDYLLGLQPKPAPEADPGPNQPGETSLHPTAATDRPEGPS